MWFLFAILLAATFAAPGLVRWKPRLAPALALIPLASGVYVGWASLRGVQATGLGWAAALGIRFSFTFDGLGLLFAYLICGIGVLIFLYSAAYLEGDPRLGRFFSYLLLFFASMLGLVTADNVMLLFVFWELTSLSSFLLIGFDHERAAARDAALQTLLVTGLGGLALLAGLVMLGAAGGSYEISEMIARGAALREHPWFVPAIVLIIAGAMTKSAQFPFHFWLPSAMEAPSPVSAYLHSATMVKAGVYLLARLAPLAAGSELWRALVTAAGAVTVVVGFLAAVPQRDGKRMLAYSTVGSLGIFTMLIGIGTPGALYGAMAMLFAHALYKASLFLYAGIMDHATGSRDVYEWRGVWKEMPYPAAAAALAGASLAGLPPFFGYVAKEQMLTALWDAPWFAAAGMVAAGIAGAVSVFLAGLLAWRPLGGQMAAEHFHAPGFLLWAPPAVLAVLGAACGLIPSLADRWLVTPAAKAITVGETPGYLSLWHGVNAPLLLSLSIIALGLVAYWQRSIVVRIADPLRRLLRFGPVAAYGVALKGVMSFAAVQTRIIQSGKLRNYMLIVFLTTTLLGYHALITRGGISFYRDWLDVRFHEGVLVVMMAVAAVAALRFESRLASVAALGVVGLGVALVFLLFGAPDLAMTQFAVEVLTVILLVLVLYHLPRFARLSGRWDRIRDLAVALAAGSLLTVSILAVNAVPHDATLARYYSENSVPQAHGRNIVNVILVDFRALDTLGEITVLAIAAVGVYGLLKLRLGKGGAPWLP